MCTIHCTCTDCANCGPEGKKPRKPGPKPGGVRKPRPKRPPRAIVPLPQALPLVLAGQPGDVEQPADDVAGWLAWAHVRSVNARRHLPPAWLPRMAAPLDEAVLPPGNVAAYTHFLRRHVFAGRGPPNGLDDMARLLDSMAGPALTAPQQGLLPEPQWQPRGRDEAEQRGWVCCPWATPAHGGGTYQVVLAACAAHIWTPPLALHKALQSLERRVMAAEAAVRAEMQRVRAA